MTRQLTISFFDTICLFEDIPRNNLHPQRLVELLVSFWTGKKERLVTKSLFYFIRAELVSVGGLRKFIV